MVSANDVLLGSSGVRYNPSDCQKPEVLNKKLVEGNILLCGYSFNFVAGSASIKKVAETARHLGAAGFVLVVENVSPGTKFDPVPSGIPGILITDVSKSMVNTISRLQHLVFGLVPFGFLGFFFFDSVDIRIVQLFMNFGPVISVFSSTDIETVRLFMKFGSVSVWLFRFSFC